jgi:hydrogenase maturation protein HypF
MAAAALHDMGRNAEIASRFSTHSLAKPLAHMLRENLNSPPTTSCGRLFDAGCGLANIKLVADYEGEAPMLFESMVQKFEKQNGLWSISQSLEIDWRPLLARIANEPSQHRSAEIFHGALVCGLTEWTLRACEQTQVKTIALAGGCFLNHILVTELVAALQQNGLKVLIPRVLPPNDGAISLGQAWVAANSQ